MKRLLILTFLSGILMGCSNNSFKITPAAEVTERLSNLETLVVVFGQSTCAACTDYKIVLQEIKNNFPDLPLVYVETDKDNRGDVTTLVERFLPNATVTPITYFFVEGVLVGQERGAFRYSQLRGFLSDKGLINE